jgi:hypothetical protein
VPPNAAAVADPPEAERAGAARRWYVLSILTLVYALSIADRFVMSTLTEPIKADLRLSDFHIAFLSGTSLALFYVTVGLPLASLADRANRRNAPFGPTFALMQNLVPASMRAQTVAILLFSANIANLVIAPQVVGFASDALTPIYGEESLRHALVPLGFAGFWAAWHYGLCAKHLASGLARAGNAASAPLTNQPA